MYPVCCSELALLSEMNNVGAFFLMHFYAQNPTVSDRVTNTGGNPADKLYDLNAGHTHFIFLDDVGFPDWDALNSFRFSFEMRLTKPVGRPRRYHHISTGKMKCFFYVTRCSITA